MVEQHPRNVQVVGSIPIVGSLTSLTIFNEYSFYKGSLSLCRRFGTNQGFLFREIRIATDFISQKQARIFRAGTSVLLCFFAEETKKEKELPPHGAQGQIHFAFEVTKEEYPHALSQIKNSDIEILHEHFWKSGLRSFYFHDPDRHLVEIIEQGLWEQ